MSAVATIPMPHLHVAAKDPSEMQTAQRQLVLWASDRISREFAELKDAQENYEVAKKAKWRAEPWKRRVQKHKAKIIFYQKLRSALKAGYYIVPPFPVDIFAIRTKRLKPLRKAQVTSGQWSAPDNYRQAGSRLPEGEGRYVSSEAEVWQNDISFRNAEGKMIERYQHYAKEFQELDFPFKMVKPETLTATAQAMALKLFDQIGVLPRFRSRGDPIVVGQILPPDWPNKEPVTFFIAWWLDTSDL